MQSTMKSFFMSRSLPCSFSTNSSPGSSPSSTCSSNSAFQRCLLPDLQEEIYSHPVEDTDANLKFDNSRQSMMASQICKECHHTPSLPIPYTPSTRQAEREEELHQELTTVYNDATWKMYHRIQNARKARLMCDRDCHGSESFKPRTRPVLL
eukprot:534893_1